MLRLVVVLLLVEVTISDTTLYTLENKRNWVHWAIILMGSICIVMVSAFSSALVHSYAMLRQACRLQKDSLAGNDLNA